MAAELKQIERGDEWATYEYNGVRFFSTSFGSSHGCYIGDCFIGRTEDDAMAYIDRLRPVQPVVSQRRLRVIDL